MSALTEGCRRDGPAYDARQRYDGEDVRDHGYELRGNGAGSLQVDLQCFGRREQEASGPDAAGLPTAKDHGRERDEPAAGRHLIRELVLIEREECPAQPGEHARRDDRDRANATHRDPDGRRRLRMLTRGTHPQAKSRPVDECGDTKNGQNSRDLQQSTGPAGHPW